MKSKGSKKSKVAKQGWHPVTDNDIGMMFANQDNNPRYENLIGYFRGDFGSDGMGFYQTWFSIHPNSMYGDLQMMDYPLQEVFPMLKDFKIMCEFCRDNPEYRFPSCYESDNCGFVTGKGKLVFYVRLLPHMGDNNFYVLCYGEEVADRIGVDLTFTAYQSLSLVSEHVVSVCGFLTYEKVKAKIPELVRAECLRCNLPEGIYLLEAEFRRYNLCTKKDEYLDREEVCLLYENGVISFMSDGGE